MEGGEVHIAQCQIWCVFCNKDFKDVLSCKHDIISLWWITCELDLNNVCVRFLVSSDEN